VDRVYKSSTPLQQAKFPEKSRRVKSYGKRTSVRIPKQETLTQMDFLDLNQPLDEDDEDLEIYENEMENLKKKRRKTTGDEPSMTPQYHTQTITQLDWSFASAIQEDDDTYNVPSSSQPHLENSTKAKPAKHARWNISRSKKSRVREIGPPQTPQRTFAQEIPSSQSPTTPASLQSRSSTTRRSPLKEQSINISIPFNTAPKAGLGHHKLPKLKVEDAFDTGTEESQQNCVPSTPTRLSSRAKGVRFAMPADVPEVVVETPSIKIEPSQFAIPPKPPLIPVHLKPTVEIRDSDAESEADDETSQDAVEHMKEDEPLQNNMQDEEDGLQPETCYSDIGHETQIKVEQLLTSNSNADATQAEDILASKSQGMESQRLSTQQVKSMAPRAIHSDVFISIHPQHVTNIVNRTKDHEIRVWLMPDTVRRIWIYETAPVSTLKYMAVIGPAKRPGEILDERGIGNAEFNAKVDRTQYAYEILELYELADPLSLAQLKANEWVGGAIRKYEWVRPVVLDNLMANLKPPLFVEASWEQSGLPSTVTDTQEAEAQLLNTIRQFTQLASSQVPSSQFAKAQTETSEEVVPSSQHETPRNVVKATGPSQATTVDLTQTQTPSRQSLAEILWESPTRPILSSTPIKLPTPRSGEYHGPDSLVLFSMASSQLLTKSQIFPESLLNDSIPGPPSFIQDSDDEEDED
jgi:hypothetical protein